MYGYQERTTRQSYARSVSHHTGIRKGSDGMAPAKGSKLSNETKQKMSAVRKGKSHSPEHAKAIGEALKGRIFTEEWKEKLGAAKRGTKISSEVKQKMSNAHKGIKNHFFGKTHTEEAKQKMAEVARLKTPEQNAAWKGGTSFLPYCHKFNKTRKQKVREFFGNMCICCGKHTTENMKHNGPISLSVHHVDHDKEQGCNNKPFNLVPLCIICHAREFSREYEYKRYINNTLGSGFEWGIWSREQYMQEVMY